MATWIARDKTKSKLRAIRRTLVWDRKSWCLSIWRSMRLFKRLSCPVIAIQSGAGTGNATNRDRGDKDSRQLQCSPAVAICYGSLPAGGMSWGVFGGAERNNASASHLQGCRRAWLLLSGLGCQGQVPRTLYRQLADWRWRTVAVG